MELIGGLMLKIFLAIFLTFSLAKPIGIATHFGQGGWDNRRGVLENLKFNLTLRF